MCLTLEEKNSSLLVVVAQGIIEPPKRKSQNTLETEASWKFD